MSSKYDYLKIGIFRMPRLLMTAYDSIRTHFLVKRDVGSVNGDIREADNYFI